MGLAVNKVLVGQVFLRVLRSPPVSIILPVPNVCGLICHSCYIFLAIGSVVQ